MWHHDRPPDRTRKVPAAANSFDYDEDYHSSYGFGSNGMANYGGFSGGGMDEDGCCPLVVDPLTLAALLAGVAGATYFLNILITMNIMMRKRRDLKLKEGFLDMLNLGRLGRSIRGERNEIMRLPT